MARDNPSSKWQRIIEFLVSLAGSNASTQVSVLEEALAAISADAAAFHKLCPQALPESVGFDINDDRFTPLGQDLLDFCPAIRRLRFELVRARRLTENEFFSRAFCGLSAQLLQPGTACSADSRADSLEDAAGPPRCGLNVEAVDDSDAIEYTLLNISRSAAFQASTSSSSSAQDWKEPIWQGRCRVLGKGCNLTIKLVAARSDDLFAECFIPHGEHGRYVAEALDSGRHFLLNLANGQGPKQIGLAFDDLCDASDFKCCLHTFGARLGEFGSELDTLTSPKIEKKDFSLREGQTITVSLKGKAMGATRATVPVEGDKVAVAGLSALPLVLARPPPPGPLSLANQAQEESRTTDFDPGDFGGFQSAEPQQDSATVILDDVSKHVEEVSDLQQLYDGDWTHVQPVADADEPRDHDAANRVNDASGQIGIQRMAFPIPRGQACVRTVPWPATSCHKAVGLAFQWKVVVLGELTVDLEMHAVVRVPSSDDCTRSNVVLQKHARGEHFVGSFTPSKDRRLLRQPHTEADCTDGLESTRSSGDFQVEEIIFNFSNTFSWLTSKDVEIVTIFETTSRESSGV